MHAENIVELVRGTQGPLVSKRLALKATEGALQRVTATAAAAAAAGSGGGGVKTEPSTAGAAAAGADSSKHRRAEALHASLKEANEAVLLQQQEQQQESVRQQLVLLHLFLMYLRSNCFSCCG